jgi:hypothetical protein
MNSKKYIQLIHFTLRTAMYVKEEKDSIAAFILGFDISNNLEFSREFHDYLEVKFKTKKILNWVDLIERLAKRRKKEWIPVFKKEALKFLIAKLDEDGLKLLQESLGTTWFAKNLKKYIASL